MSIETPFSAAKFKGFENVLAEASADLTVTGVGTLISVIPGITVGAFAALTTSSFIDNNGLPLHDFSNITQADGKTGAASIVFNARFKTGFRIDVSSGVDLPLIIYSLD